MTTTMSRPHPPFHHDDDDTPHPFLHFCHRFRGPIGPGDSQLDLPAIYLNMARLYRHRVRSARIQGVLVHSGHHLVRPFAMSRLTRLEPSRVSFLDDFTSSVRARVLTPSAASLASSWRRRHSLILPAHPYRRRWARLQSSQDFFSSPQTRRSPAGPGGGSFCGLAGSVFHPRNTHRPATTVLSMEST